MACISYKKFWKSEFDNIVSKKDKVQDMNINQLKLQVHDSYEKDEKITTNFEPFDTTDVINKAHSDEKSSEKQGHISYIEKDYNEFKLHNKEGLLIERAVRTTIRILYVTGFFDKHANADQVVKDYLLVEVNARRRPDLEESKRCHPMILFININEKIKQPPL